MSALARRDLLRAAGAAAVGTAAIAAMPDVAAASPPAARHGSGRLTISSEPFGTMPDGTPVERYTFGNGRVTVQMLTLGATVQTLSYPDRHGRVANVSLGLTSVSDYLTKSPYFGSTIGRYANRIAGAQFTLDGVTYQIPPNDGSNALHGGPVGFDKHVWSAEVVRTRDSVGVAFTYVSPDGEMGFPGTLTTVATYRITTRDELVLTFRATTDKPTVLNLANHTYFNLTGDGTTDIYDHVLRLHARRYTPVDATLIPLGTLDPVVGTPFDFRHPTPIGQRIRFGDTQLVLGRGYDHNFVLDGSGPREAAVVHDPASGRVLRIATDQPGVQLYTGNFLDATIVGQGGHMYRQGDAFCLETQHFPNSPNQPNFPSTVLRPGQVFRSTTSYALSAR
jgi:aldose 1-epimerase